MGLAQDLIAQGGVPRSTRAEATEASEPLSRDVRRVLRSVSFLIDEACRLILSTKSTHRPLREQLARGFEHSQMKIASNAFANARPSPWTSLFGDPPVIPADLRRVARAFVDLQEERHEADYNLSKTLVKSRK